ncbi:acyl-CoA dehydrogenase family protein [Sphingobium agri]|uniref:Acyl-CoA dehydrogenase n=1 Tax=Sphingobium agri TaxID=2933566 RepID=A0ABT0DSH5_9SPHN|nr:acyl-CoA dehydrogenase [Sphingobium agri]MCK0530065.1 acyl-CoA dehydrogenase [Sphingobium agri]
MDFNYTAEQDALRDSVKRFVEREYDWDKRFAIIRSADGVAPDHWGAFAELGWLGAGLAEEAGGFGGGPIENALIAEELGRGLVTEPFIGHVLASQLLAAVGSDSASTLLTNLIMGEQRAAAALQEPVGRGDWRIVEVRAEGSGSSRLLTGVKSLVEAARQADMFLVTARQDDRIGIYLVSQRQVGLELRPYRTLDNRRVCDLHLNDASAELLMEGEDAERAIALAADHAIIALCGEALGIMDTALWTTRDYLKVRKQFGTTLSNFQALQHRMADMLIEVEMTRSALFNALGAMQQEEAVRTAAVSAAKVQASNAGLFVGQQAIQLHGGIGVTEELNISHHYRRLFVIARQFGDADMHLARFARATDEVESR